MERANSIPFGRLQGETSIELRQATQAERILLAQKRATLALYPLDNGSPIGVNEQLGIIAYLSRGDITYAPLSPRFASQFRQSA